MSIPQEPVMLLSYINTQLRDYHPNLVELCKTLNIDLDELTLKLKSIDYLYDEKRNQFI